MIAIGSTLKEARNKKAVSFEEVHAKTKIHPRVLQLLEEEKFDKLPSPLFVKSFLKSYAEFLEVNPEELVQAYEKSGNKKEPEQMLYLKSAGERAETPNVSSNTLPVFLLLAGLTVVGFLVFYLGKSAVHWFHTRKSAVVLKAAKAERPKVAKETAGLKLPPNAEANKSDEWLYSVPLGNFPKLSEKTPLRLRIRAINNVWLRITCDGKVLFESILKRGVTEIWIGNERIEL